MKNYAKFIKKLLFQNFWYIILIDIITPVISSAPIASDVMGAYHVVH